MSIEQDIGRKCGYDVGDAIRRNMLLMDDRRGAMIVASYGAAVAIGNAIGAYSAFADGPIDINPAMIDQLWSEILRPMVLGEMTTQQEQTS